MTPPLSHEELEERLTAAGNSLLQPPDELLPLLDRIEELLSKVEQSPAKSMQTALSPLMKALVAEELVKHSDTDVKVGVASCISEITRITAPDAPYDDEKMKDVFQLIVSSFQNLSDTSSRSHEKRVTILETVAKVRSCVIMLDLECDQMIIEMFQHFIQAIGVYHSEVIFASMETIMTLVLEESEDISPDLLNPILTTLKKSNEAVLPIAKKLAERVIQNCADKLRPCLTQAVKTLDASLDDYIEVVASLCRENSGTIGCSNENILEDQSVVERTVTSASPVQDQVAKGGIEETNFQENDPAVMSPKSIESNGINETGTEETMSDANYPKKANSDHQLDAGAMSKTKSDDLSGQEPVKLEAKPEHEEAQQVPYNSEVRGKDVHISPCEVKPVEAANSMDKVKDTTIQLSPSKTPENEAVNVASLTQSGSLSVDSQSKKEAKRKEDLITEETISVDTASKKASVGRYISKAKKHRSRKKRADKTANNDKALAEESASKNDDGGTSDSETRSLDQTEKLGDASNKTEDGSSLRKEDHKKSARAKPKSEKDVLESYAREDHGKNTVTSPSSPLKSTKDEIGEEETPRTGTKRKRTPGTEKTSGTKEYGKNLVGSKVKVWWPKDRMFYEGVVASFDSVKKKHKVSYTDGDEEVLNLRKERWEFVGEELVSEGDQAVEHSSHEASSDMKKKGHTNSEASSKRGKMEASPKSKLKETATKSGGKSKDKAEQESKVNNSKSTRKSEDSTSKSKSQPQKSWRKCQGDSAKASGGSKDSVAKTSSHSKKDGQQTAKLKGKTPQSGKSLSVNGAKKTKTSSSKVKETDRIKEKTMDSKKLSETTKGRSSDTAKSQENDTRGGKKRRR
ncbi:hypothetical protein BUALT_Bualt10G0140900 [Buddleja alternifolia]|uniref:Uncharacterized protein n=1 Tax=Buddleja alternifolia TaxID=168488 RepID=A0AAV6X017_9LAMI|nr:hypothetical protein BUALT_Bualt10G0140900 [Buddleja alternifolia]